MVDHSNKRRKFHDKDKYYRLAKEQGLRSRAAFKLSQINRKFPILENAKVVLDLCAAPGGWTQIASRTSPKSLVVAVDILPIRSLGMPNVVTLVGDITTDQCKAAIKRELQQNSTNSQVDVVLHDGAPNVGASYDKDAYQQVELALHALKCATQHLRPNGSFVTKLYRSRDYPSFVWVAKQLFQQVQAVKPTASRSQSAEIFLVCEGYLAADSLDPRMLDPKFIFESVQGDSTGGGNQGSNANVFSKNWNGKQRQRNGYDMEHFSATMQHVQPVSAFVEAPTDPIMMLSKCTGMSFTCQKCADENEDDDGGCNCAFYLKHATQEIKECLTDLQVLNKSDFKNLLTWRTKVQGLLKEQTKDSHRGDDEDVDETSIPVDGPVHQKEETEVAIQKEIAEMRRLRLRQAKKVKKKERALAAKRRKRSALGMDLNAIEVPDNEKIFSLATITSKGELEAIIQAKQPFNMEDNEDDSQDEGKESEDDQEESTDYSYRLDRELDDAYDLYLKTTKDGMAKSGTKMAKRSKKLQRQKAAEQAQEDTELLMTDNSGMDYDTKTYAKMLAQGGDNNSDDEDDDEASNNDEDHDGFHADPMTPEEYAAKSKHQKNTKKQVNPLVYKLPEDPSSVKATRWFSNPLFESIGNAAQLASLGNRKSKHDEDDEDDDDVGSIGSDAVEYNFKNGISADEVLAMMPKTDKQIRHERRRKASEREERKKTRRARKAGEDEEGAFEVTPSSNRTMHQEGEEDRHSGKHEGLSEAENKKMVDARALIKAGMGSAIEEGDGKRSFEIVATDADDTRPLPIRDHRKYDSEYEDYDSDDYVQTLALGTMMLRHSKAKALVDASYNRYAWNDPSDLPDWFVDDENKHYRPQLPIPPALLQKMKDKVLHLSTKPIAKVAEARARKSKRARNKLVAAKKKAEAVANSSEMSEAMKLKAISKAMRGSDAKGGGRSYVVSKKGGATKGVKGAKMVDKRMKSDARGMDRAEKKRKGRKAGGRSKRKRHG